MTEQTCTGCGETKPVEAFTKSSRRASGRTTKCKACNAAYTRKLEARRREAGEKSRHRLKPGTRFLRVGYLANGKRKWVRLYAIWRSMRERCMCLTYRDYPYYGGRGITVCEEWNDYAVFRKWAISAGFRKDLTLDRIDNDLGYSPANCRWASMPEQCENKRSTIIVEHEGERAPLWRLAQQRGLDINVARYRYRVLGWPVAKILSTPKGALPR